MSESGVAHIDKCGAEPQQSQLPPTAILETLHEEYQRYSLFSPENVFIGTRHYKS